MPKAYLIAHIRAHDLEKMQEFSALARPAVAKHGGTVLVTDMTPARKEGPDNGIAVVIEFESIRPLGLNLFVRCCRVLLCQMELLQTAFPQDPYAEWCRF